MFVVRARNAHQMLPELMYQLRQNGIKRQSRNGPVLRISGPTCLEYERPTERVVFWPERDANPFFHLLEAMWMLAGRNDVAYVSSIVSSMAQFSDNGREFHGAYGYRWRNHFHIDQVLTIALALKANPDCRRQVLAMWDCPEDLGVNSKDIPCNTHAYFSRDENGRLDMTVCNRSNDAVWGAVGANCVHFTVLQEFIAGLIGCEVGKYWQVSNNMHLYLDKHESLMNQLADIANTSEGLAQDDPYAMEHVYATPLLPFGDAERFDRDMRFFLDEGMTLGITDQFVRKVLVPVVLALMVMKRGEAPRKFESARLHLAALPEKSDWRIACEQWVDRRQVNWEKKCQAST